MSRSKNRKIADLISGGTFDDGVVAASEVTGLHTVASTGNFNELENKPAPFDPATLADVAVSGSFNDLADQPAPFDPATLSTVAVSGSFNDLSNQPAPFDPATLSTVAVSGSFNDLSNQPTPFNPSTLATVATTGAYSSLSGTPSIPSAGSLPVAASSPASGNEGSLYYNTTEDQLYLRTGSIWTPLVSKPPVATGGTAALTASSLVPFSYDLSPNFTQENSGALLYSLVDGTLPTGLSLPTSGSSLAFTPPYSATSASYSFRLKATNEAGLASSPKSYTFSVGAAPVYGLFNLGSTPFPSGTLSVTSGGYKFKRYLGSANFNAVIATGAGIGEAFVLLWGAGGRKHSSVTSGHAGFGGWGLAKVTSLQITNSSVRIETGGTGGTTTTATPALGGSIGGGASGGPYSSDYGYNRGAGGGGLTAMFSSTSRTHSQTVLAVGSGGGQSTDGNQAGGSGGGFNEDGKTANSGTRSGGFATLSAGGAGGGYDNGSYFGIGQNGSALTGGTGALGNYDGGCGGGAGYYGGGGGMGGGGYSGGGGGGGSGYAISEVTVLSTGTLVSSTSTNRATLQAAITSAIGVSYSLPNLGGNSAAGGFVIIQVT